MDEVKISARLEQAFPEPKNLNMIDSYLQTIRANMKDLEDKFQHSYQLLLLLMLIFELLTRAAISEVSIGPIKLSDLQLFQKLLPLVIAFIYFTTMSLGTMRRLQREVHDEIIKRYYESLYKTDMEYYLLPPSSFVTAEIVGRSFKGFMRNGIKIPFLPFLTAIILGPVVFEIYAFKKCFSIFGSSDWLIWCSMIISILLVVEGFLLFWRTDKFTGI